MAGMCKDCVSGSLHDGTPTGRVETVHGLQAYVKEPEDASTSKGIIVVIPDAFGWELPNLRILCDNYAKAGFKVIMPEFMDGHWAAHSVLDSMEIVMDSEKSLLSRITSGLHAAVNIIPFAIFTRAAVTGPRVYDFFTKLRAAEPDTKIGAAGFCWGGMYTFYLVAPPSAQPLTRTWFEAAQQKTGNASALSVDRPLVDAGYTAHPSKLVLPDDAERVVAPISVANGTRDIQVTPAKAPLVQRAFEKINADAGEQRHVYVSYEDALHGFAVRWNPKDERQNRQGAESEAQAVEHFTKWFK